MRVIKLGTDLDKWRLDVTCGFCKSELEIDAGDIKHRGDPGDYRDPGYDHYWVNCPACSNEITVAETKLPALVRAKAEKRGSK